MDQVGRKGEYCQSGSSSPLNMVVAFLVWSCTQLFRGIKESGNICHPCLLVCISGTVQKGEKWELDPDDLL